MAKLAVKPHKKTIIYIVPEGREAIPSEVVECFCEDAKGVDHASAKYKREPVQSSGEAL
jgi:hypothetical protein